MTIPSAPGTGPTGAAIGFVTEGWDFFETKINVLLDKTLGLVDNLQTVPGVEPISFHVDFPDITPLTGFSAPTAPVLSEITYNPVTVPAPPDAVTPAAPAQTAAPAFDVAPPPPISLPAQPDNFAVAAPGPAPTVATLVMPDLPVLPASPDYLATVLPTLDPLPTFSGRDPGDAPRLNTLGDVGFSETAYTPAVLDALTPAIRRALSTGQLLDSSIEQALFARGRDRLLQGQRAALQEIDEQFAARGFKQPTGAWAAARTEQLRKTGEAIADLNRETTIAQYTQAIEAVKFAVVQGIALEQVLIGQHSQIMDRALQSARLLLDTHVALHNADVASYNAAVERFKADSAVFSDRLQAVVETYKAQVAGVQASADVNKARAESFAAEAGAIADQYRALVAGVQAQADVERARIEAHRTEVEAYAARVDAYGKQWDGFRAAVDAQAAGFRSFEIGTNAYTARVNAWAEGERAKTARYEADVRAAGLRFDGYRAQVQGVLGQLQAEQARIGTLQARNEALSRQYQAAAAIETARSDANVRALTALSEAASNRANAELREAEIKIQDAQRVLAAQLEAIRGAAGALAQLAAAAMSGVSFNAGVNGSGSESMAWSYSWSKSKGWGYNGETPDSASPDVF